VATAVGAAQQLIYIQILPMLKFTSDQIFDIGWPPVGHDCIPLLLNTVGNPLIVVLKLAGP
jgi:hypothetical protein